MKELYCKTELEIINLDISDAIMVSPPTGDKIGEGDVNGDD